MSASADFISETTFVSFGVIVIFAPIKQMILQPVSFHVRHLPNEALSEMPPHSLFIVQRNGGVGILNDLNLLDDGPCCWVESLEQSARRDQDEDYDIIGYVIWCIVEPIDSADTSKTVYVSMKVTYEHKMMVSNHRLDFDGSEIEKPEDLIPMMEEYEGFIH